MRLTVPVFGRYRYKPIKYGTAYIGDRLNMNDYVYTPPAPVALLDKVSDKKEKSKRGMCLQEMALMMACWNEHDYSETICAKEMQAFEKCWKDAEKQEKLIEEQEKLGMTTQGRLSSSNVNKLLRRFPQPEPKPLPKHRKMLQRKKDDGKL